VAKNITQCVFCCHERASVDRREHICKETIYAFIYAKENEELGLIKLLQKGNKKHKKKRGNRKKRPKTIIKNRVSIWERPPVDGVFGHFEGDSIVSKMGGSNEAIHTRSE
jgi:IS30 family transposase